MGTPGSEVVSDPPPTAVRVRLRRIVEHISKEWPSALLVVSLVAIAHTHLYWFKAFEAYTFLGIGQLASIGAAGDTDDYRAVVALIDQSVFENEHHERSPLNRDAIARDLRQIYAAKPDVVVVDLDVSPDGWDRLDRCTPPPPDALDEALSAGHLTVVLEPFEVQNPCIRRMRQLWKRDITAASGKHVRFVAGTLPVSYGVHVKTYRGAQGLGPVVTELMHGREREFAPQIDPRQLLKGLKIFQLSERAELEKGLSAALDTAAQHNDGKRVVFYGAAYGSGDTFLSAVGEIYGVEAHAAAYVSDHVSELHLTGFVVDLLIALGLGLVIAFFWRKYFDARLSTDDYERQIAKAWIVLLANTVIGLVFLLTVGSLIVLLTLGWWITPLPIAVGMLIDSFVSGSVDQATHKFRSLTRPHAPTTLRAPDDDAPGTGVLVIGERYLPRALGGELCKLLRERKTAAASLLGVWTVIWSGITIYALYSITQAPH